MNTFIQQGCIKLIKIDSEDIYNVTKRFSKNHEKIHREAQNQHIRMISERSCDTEDWSLHLKIY